MAKMKQVTMTNSGISNILTGAISGCFGGTLGKAEPVRSAASGGPVEKELKGSEKASSQRRSPARPYGRNW